ncbi:MAG TPA: glutathione transferase GstA [Xanthobacteraceae bacterium]|nr:glutathione transferase GstA [Xanthobacteraceae bacterium]
MKLYFSPGACSLSPHIILREAGADFEIEQVDNRAKKTKSGADYWRINPKGYVPTLELDDGQRLTEGPVIVQYIADRYPQAGLIPPCGSFERYRVQEWLNFITSEIHKTFTPLFRDTTPAEYKSIAKENLGKRYDFIEQHLAANDYLAGGKFGVADAYLFVVSNWLQRVGIDTARWPNLRAYLKRIGSRPKVEEAMKAEGLRKAA